MFCQWYVKIPYIIYLMKKNKIIGIAFLVLMGFGVYRGIMGSLF